MRKRGRMDGLPTPLRQCRMPRATAMAASIGAGTSPVTPRAASVRGSPRKTAPKDLGEAGCGKASDEREGDDGGKAGHRECGLTGGVEAPRYAARVKIISSLIKPLKKGSPHMATEPNEEEETRSGASLLIKPPEVIDLACSLSGGSQTPLRERATP